MYKIARILVIVLSGGGLWAGGLRALAEDVGFFPQTTYKIVQLTGETDKPRRIPTLSRMNSRYCVSATDLGSTFEHKGQLCFLFGDTPSLGEGTDFLAWTSSARPEDIILDVYRNGSCARPIAIPDVRLAWLEVPSCGISVDGAIYLVATTDSEPQPDAKIMGKSVMAVSHDDGLSFQKIYDLSVLSEGGKFINVSMVQVNGLQFPTLPAERCVLIWGSGTYRQSDVFLAYVPSLQIADKAAIRYLSKVNGSTPHWTNNQATALFSLFDPPQPYVGELSVQYCQQLGKWIMLYNSTNYGVLPSGIHMRSADWPWGPWSQPTVIFDGDRDNAYGTYMHLPGWDVFHDSPLIGPEDNKVGPYGPYLIPRFFRGDQNRVTIVYSMSTWNPYQTLLMQSDIGYPNRVPPENIITSVTLPGDTGAGWLVSGNFLWTFTHNGVPYVTSHANKGDADMGVAQYGFFASGCDQALEFKVHGGDAEVVLIEQSQDVPTAPPNLPAFYDALKRGDFGRVVETIIGPQSNDHELTVRWDLRRHQGKMMRLLLIDKLTEPWGFISVSQVTRYFVTGNAPANIYVDKANTSSPFLGTSVDPFPTVTLGYNATVNSACSANLIIRAGNYPETLTMNKSVTLNAEGGAATIGQ